MLRVASTFDRGGESGSLPQGVPHPPFGHLPPWNGGRIWVRRGTWRDGCRRAFPLSGAQGLGREARTPPSALRAPSPVKRGKDLVAARNVAGCMPPSLSVSGVQGLDVRQGRPHPPFGHLPPWNGGRIWVRRGTWRDGCRRAFPLSGAQGLGREARTPPSALRAPSPVKRGKDLVAARNVAEWMPPSLSPFRSARLGA